AGNAVILKVAAATPLVGEAINKIIAAGDLPKGLFQQIVGSGGAVSKSFFENNIDKIFFTGSVGVGKQLMSEAAKTLTPLSLELGGNDPMIVLADADLERATNGAAWAGFQNAGQSCGGVERVYVHASIYDDFVELMAKKTRALRHGIDESHNVDIGCLTTKSQLNTVKEHLEDALAKGAKIVAQSQPVGPQNGYFHPATLLTNTTDDMLFIRDETFGPLIPVIKFSTEEEAIALANDSHLALTSSVWTKNAKKGRAFAAKLESGVTTINDHLYTHGLSEMPWGGWKHSGLGRTHGPEGLLEMTHAKAVNWDILPSKRNLWWYPFSEASYEGLLNAQRFVYPRSKKELVTSAAKLTPFLVGKMFSKWNVK
ncbi:MAG: aldehyde dehydrogenase family protein, partial [Pseudomonadales bacterium]|nr:aldehyde dehydrogenase family protein [Pseudomonadales bacterium]